MYRNFTGIDEAALGPVLGPYCCAAASFDISDEIELFDQFQAFGALQIGDSKKLFTQGKSLAGLELTVLAFLRQTVDGLPENLLDMLKLLIQNKENLEELKFIPWFGKLESYAIPAHCGIDDVEEKSRMLRSFLAEKAIYYKGVAMDVVPAIRFNRYLAGGLNKSETCQNILTPLIENTLKDKSRITVDRQGGRRYYGEWLLEMFPGKSLAIRQETPDLSRYDVGDSTVSFQVKGDDKYLETALASIFSKYIREMMMECFNDYWTLKIPGLKRTAGYPQDGKRFIKDLVKEKAEFVEEQLIRRK